MLALHRGRTALTLACLLATAVGGAATRAPDADAAFGQVKSAFGSWGTASGQLDQPGGLAYRPATNQLYVADQYTDDSTGGDPAFRIQRLSGTDGTPADANGLWVDDDYLNGWQGGLTYTGDIAVDPRAGQSHLYALMQPQDVDGSGGKVLEINPDAPTSNPANAAPTPRAAFPVAAGKGTLNYATGLAVDPAGGDVLVGDVTSAAAGGKAIVRRFSAASDHAAGTTLALTDVDLAPTATAHGARHVSVRAIAARGDGTIAVLSDAQETQLQDGTVIDTPVSAAESLIDVYSPAGAHVAGFTVPSSRPSIAFAPDGDVAVPDPTTGGITEYDPAAANPGAGTGGYGAPATQDPPAPCTFAATPVALSGTAADLYVLDHRPTPANAPVVRIVHLAEGGTGCGSKVHDTAIAVGGEPARKGQAVTFTGTAVDDGGPLPDSAFTWTLDGTTRTGRTFSYTFATTGDKDVTLKVTNGTSTATAKRTVHVSSVAPVAAFTVTGDGATAPATVSFDASGSSDPDGTIASYGWSTAGASADDASGARITHTYTSPGSYAVRLTVVDDDGDSTILRKTITIAAPQGPPPGGGVDPTPDPAPKQVVPPPGNLGGQSGAPQPGKATISLGGTLTPDAKGRLKVKLSCPAGTSGCSGTLIVVSAKAVASKASKKKVLTLAKATYKVTAGGSATVTLTLTGAAKKALAKLKSVAIVATAKGADGATSTAKGTVKAARKGKR